MAGSNAGFFAKQGLSLLYNATVTSVSAISSGINTAVKSYTDYYERDQIDKLKKSGKRPADNLHAVLQRFYYLSMAGYNNEVAAAAQKAAAKLTTGEKSSVLLESVAVVSRVLGESCSKYGSSDAGGWGSGLSDFLNSARMGKDHFDRDQLVTDLYFAILFAQDIAGGPGPEFERIIREGAGRMVEGDAYVDSTGSGFGGGGYTPSAFSSSSGLPSYAQVPSAYGGSTTSTGFAKSASTTSSSSSSSALGDSDPKKKAAKVLNVVALSIKKASDEAESKKIRTLREAEEMLQREKQKAAAQGGGGMGAATPAAAPKAFGSSSFSGSAAPVSGGFGGSSSGFGSGSTYGSGGAGGFGGGSSGFSGSAGYGAPAGSYGAASGGGGFGGSSSFGGSGGFGGQSSSFGSSTGYGSTSAGSKPSGWGF